MHGESYRDGMPLDCPIDKNNYQVVAVVAVVGGGTRGSGALDTDNKGQQGSKLTAEGGR